MFGVRNALPMFAVVLTLLLGHPAHAELVGLWQFDQDVSPQPDASGNGNDGQTMGDITWVNDPERGGVMDFDGDQDYLLVADSDSLSIEGELTIAAWVNMVDFDSWRSIMGKTGSVETNKPAPYDMYAIQGGDGRLRAYFGNGTNPIGFADSDLPPELEQWQHIAMTITEDGEVTHYLDGEENGFGFVDAPRVDDDEDLYIGSRADLVTNMLGMMDDVAIFDEVLSPEQIQQIMGGDFSDYGVGGATRLEAGDSDQDLDFDQLDLVKVQIAAKFLTGQPATWGDGDWNGAPGGEPGSPPAGNGLFDQLDIIAALSNGLYMTGPYGAVAAHPNGSGQATLRYNPSTGELAVQAGPTELTSINIDSAAGIFTGDAAANLGGSFDNDSDGNIFKATFGGSFGSLSFGNVAQTGLSEDFVLADLTVVGSLAGGGDLGDVDLIYVPEPTAIVLLTLGLVGALWMRRRV